MDTGLYGLVTYSILDVSNDGGSKFRMYSNGTLFVISSVVRSAQYEILVQAQDSDPDPLTRRLVPLIILSVTNHSAKCSSDFCD